VIRALVCKLFDRYLDSRTHISLCTYLTPIKNPGINPGLVANRLIYLTITVLQG